MAYMSFETKEDWKEYQNKMDVAMWGIYATNSLGQKDYNGYWNLVHFGGWLERFIGDDFDYYYFLQKSYNWEKEYDVLTEISIKLETTFPETDWLLEINDYSNNVIKLGRKFDENPSEFKAQYEKLEAEYHEEQKRFRGW